MSRIFLLILFPALVLSKKNCGGVFTSKRGVLQTPDFPKKFPTPIECEWIIKSDFENSSIVVYLTQMYLYEGLTFTEYAQYDRRLPGNRIEEIPAGEDFFQVKYLQSYKSALVINLKLNSMDNVNLRVQNGFMDVYGFNITYEIAAKVREDHCTVMDCQLNGYCFDYITHFGCECFEGYTGKHCLEGRKSACLKNSEPLCKNGATCRHIGDNGVMCHCTPGFQGRLCDEAAIDERNDHESDLCVSKPEGNVCHCAESDKLQQFKNDLQVFTVTARFMNLPEMKEEEQRGYVKNEIAEDLRDLDVKYVHIISFESVGPEVDVTVRFYGPKAEEMRISRLVAEWSTSGRIGRARTVDRDVQLYHQPIILSILSVAINKPGEIHEKDQFILSCKIQASPNRSIRWYKDGLLVNVSRTIHRWSSVQKLDSTSQLHLAMLGIDEASSLDTGRYTCVAEDYGIKQCLSRTVRIATKPEVSLEPMSLTVAKGQRFAVECSSDAKGQTSYSWAKDGELLPTRTKREHYETLYLTGSLLRVKGLNKSTNYSCLVQKGTVRQEKSIYVVVIDPKVINPCVADNSSGVFWTETAPGCESIKRCPPDHRGVAKRSCVMKDNHFPEWDVPDMSRCISATIGAIIKRFRYLRLGYEATTPSETLAETLKYAQKSELLQGEGVVVLNLIADVADHIKQLNYSEDIHNISTTAISVINSILRQNQSVINEKQVTLIQTTLKNILFNSKPFLPATETFVTKYDYLISNLYPINQLTNFSSHLSGFGTKISFRLKHIEQNKQYLSSTSGIIYNNLYRFLPSKSVLRINGTEINYIISSDIATTWYIDQSTENFELILNFQLRTNNENYNYTCVSSEYAPYDYFWSMDHCETFLLNSTTVQCNCTKFGTFTVIGIEGHLTSLSIPTNPNRIVVITGCCICLLLSVFTSTLLLFHWLFRKSAITFIKLQCSTSTIGAMSIFILAQTNSLNEGSYLYTQAFLQTFLLIGLSTQLSLLLIVYADLLQLNKKKNNLKTTSICVVTGPALITVFGNYLSHVSMNLRTYSWWVIAGTTSFFVFTVCCGILIVSYHMLYVVISRHIKGNKNIDISKKRIVLFNKSIYMFYAMLILIFSSVVYINLIENIVSHVIFSLASVSLGVTLLFCYVLKSDDILEQYFLKRINDNETSKKNSSISSSEIIEGPQVEETRDVKDQNSKEFVVDSQKGVKSTRAPDILSSENCVKLDLVSSSAKSTKGSEGEQKSVKRVHRRTCKCCARDKKGCGPPQKPQPGCSKKFASPKNDKKDFAVSLEVEGNGQTTEILRNIKADVAVVQPTENIDEVMISISEDLDYLLNRNIEIK